MHGLCRECACATPLFPPLFFSVSARDGSSARSTVKFYSFERRSKRSLAGAHYRLFMVI
jgi:hypothetical protein